MSYGTWAFEDLVSMAKVLNAGAVSFPGVDFRGWSIVGTNFTVPEVSGAGDPVAFGRLAHTGPARPFATYGCDDPTRRGELLLEVYTPGSGDLRIVVPVIELAVGVLDANEDPTVFGRNVADLVPGQANQPYPNFTPWGSRATYQANTVT